MIGDGPPTFPLRSNSGLDMNGRVPRRPRPVHQRSEERVTLCRKIRPRTRARRKLNHHGLRIVHAADQGEYCGQGEERFYLWIQGNY